MPNPKKLTAVKKVEEEKKPSHLASGHVPLGSYSYIQLFVIFTREAEKLDVFSDNESKTMARVFREIRDQLCT